MVNRELRQQDMSPLQARPLVSMNAPKPIASNTIDHPGSDLKPAQPQDQSSLPELDDFDPNDISNNDATADYVQVEQAPIGNLNLINQ